MERAASGIILPVYDLAPDLVLRAVENASSVVPGATDDAGEYMAMALVDSIPAAAVPDGSVIILPLAVSNEGAIMDFTYLAASSHMFITVNFRPQPRLTYGHCLAYTTGKHNLFLLDLLHWVLNNNYFTFQTKNYLQLNVSSVFVIGSITLNERLPARMQ